jgi:hypothetical protein
MVHTRQEQYPAATMLHYSHYRVLLHLVALAVKWNCQAGLQRHGAEQMAWEQADSAANATILHDCLLTPKVVFAGHGTGVGSMTPCRAGILDA